MVAGVDCNAILHGVFKMLDYGSLSKDERRAAKKLAKDLLRTVPAAQKAEEPSSIRVALNTVFLEPENVIGALVYSDGNGNWWGEVVLSKSKKRFQLGTAEECPARSPEDALGQVKAMIASIKGMREHPLVQEFRDRGFDPERVELLQVRHE